MQSGNRDKAKIEVIKNNCNRKKNLLAQNQREVKRMIRREKIIWEENINRIEEKYINTNNFFKKTNELTNNHHKGQKRNIDNQGNKNSKGIHTIFQDLLNKTIDELHTSTEYVCRTRR